MESYIITFDDQNDIFHLKILRPLDKDGILDLAPRFLKLFEGRQHRNILVDMTESSQFDSGFLTKELRKLYKELMKQMDVDKSAIVGASPAVRMIARIAIAVSGKSDVNKFFETKEEAMAWLKGDDKQ